MTCFIWTQIAAVWTHLSWVKTGARAQKGLLQPHCTQIVAVLCLLGADQGLENHLIEVSYIKQQYITHWSAFKNASISCPQPGEKEENMFMGPTCKNQ